MAIPYLPLVLLPLIHPHLLDARARPASLARLVPPSSCSSVSVVYPRMSPGSALPALGHQDPLQVYCHLRASVPTCPYLNMSADSRRMQLTRLLYVRVSSPRVVCHVEPWTGVLYHDHFLTLDDETLHFWRLPITRGNALFFLNRYFSFFANIGLIVARYSVTSHDVCWPCF
jgi:hypothetical protein